MIIITHDNNNTINKENIDEIAEFWAIRQTELRKSTDKIQP